MYRGHVRDCCACNTLVKHKYITIDLPASGIEPPVLPTTCSTSPHASLHEPTSRGGHKKPYKCMDVPITLSAHTHTHAPRRCTSQASHFVDNCTPRTARWPANPLSTCSAKHDHKWAHSPQFLHDSWTSIRPLQQSYKSARITPKHPEERTVRERARERCAVLQRIYS